MPCALKRSCTLHSFLGSFAPNPLYIPPSHSNSVKSSSDINLSFFVFSFLSCFAPFLVSGASVPCYPTSCLISRPVVPLTFNLQTYFTLLGYGPRPSTIADVTLITASFCRFRCVFFFCFLFFPTPLVLICPSWCLLPSFSSFRFQNNLCTRLVSESTYFVSVFLARFGVL